MKKINLRKMLLALADVFIIVVSGILAIIFSCLSAT